jgi:ATP-dependent Clp protease ATP-binding subunit ClpX
VSPLAGPAARSLPDPATALQQRVAAIPVHSPRQLDARLEALGYRGQAAARRAACVLAWRHVRRLQRLHLDGIDPSELPDRDSYLLLGPTGCGKTHLVELLFREVLEVPAVVVDITQFSETGYVGNDVGTILTRLVAAAGGNPAWAACGVVCLDEFDKLAGSTSTARFAGAETTKDVSGWGVQRSLLGLLSGTYAEYQPDYGYSGRTAPSHLPLAGITFLACGAFSGVRQARESVRPVGFGEGRPGESRAARPALEPAALERFGFMPELIGRFTRVVELEPLALPELRRILDRQACLQARELGAEGLRLDLDEAELTSMAERALRSGHGARGLRAALALRIEELVYDGVVEPVGRPR